MRTMTYTAKAIRNRIWTHWGVGGSKKMTKNCQNMPNIDIIKKCCFCLVSTHFLKFYISRTLILPTYFYISYVHLLILLSIINFYFSSFGFPLTSLKQVSNTIIDDPKYALTYFEGVIKINFFDLTF